MSTDLVSVEDPNAAKTKGRYLCADGCGFLVSLVRRQVYYNSRIVPNYPDYQ